MQVELISYPDGDIEGNEGMDSLVIDAVEMERFERSNPPSWIASLRAMFDSRNEIALAAS